MTTSNIPPQSEGNPAETSAAASETGAPTASTPHPAAPGAQPGGTPQAGYPAAPQAAPGAQAPAAGQAGAGRKLSTFLKVSIILLTALTIASISLVFIGDFEGKFVRVFSTFLLFAVFVVLTAFDTRRDQKTEWYAPVALVSNAYILGLLLIVIWMTRYVPLVLGFDVFWQSLLVIIVVRLVILGTQFLLQVGEHLPGVVTQFAFLTSVLGVLSAILFTAPLGVQAFNITIPDLYWQIATATLILTALALSITLLLRWSYGSDEREAKRRRRAEQAAEAQRAYHAQVSQQHAADAPHPQQTAAAPQAPAQPAPQQLLPWPTFTDGSPYPAGPDGQPDFAAAQRM